MLRQYSSFTSSKGEVKQRSSYRCVCVLCWCDVSGIVSEVTALNHPRLVDIVHTHAAKGLNGIQHSPYTPAVCSPWTEQNTTTTLLYLEWLSLARETPLCSELE